ncbi:unnamed protein product [Rotaria magnacalcarata]|uniref:PLAT domain-containing protein n=4 Tax=Rotaria magnacalcarata TaxID=392030 RepID=A0A816PEA5_9BILA|nr:unnamed protein product [Rotaria magnacalcarata]
MQLIIQQLYSVFFFSICSFGSHSSIEQHNTCMSKPLTYHDVERHFNYSSSSLFFLFGINIHRPFLNEFDQTHAEASIFIVVVCKKNSSNCISQNESLPTEYKLEFSVDGVPYSDKNSKIDRRWHRTKAANYEFLYEPFNSHSWYDKPDNEQGSVWKNFIMNMDSYEQENIHSKWVEFDVELSDAGMQFIEGQQLHNNVVVQQFKLYFFVSTFQCLQPPFIYFDGLISKKTYLSAFHLQLMSDKCHLYKYTCYLNMKKITTVNSTEATFNESHTINISINSPLLYSQRISNEQDVKPSNFINRIYENVAIENSVSLSHNQFYLDANCTNKNLITSRQFLLCTQDYFQYDTSIAKFRIDIILCKYAAAYSDRCNYSRYEYILDEYLRLFIPIEGDNITFIGFMRLNNGLSSNEWRNHLQESYDKIYPNELQNTYDYMIEIKSNINSENSIIRYYQIITDQSHVCHLICRTNCVQKSPDHTDYYVSNSTVELILLCFQCSFTNTYNSLNHSILYFFSQLSRDSALLRIQITEKLQHISVNCYDAQSKQYSIEGKFHFRNQTNNNQHMFCSINPTIIYPYHEDIILECNHSYTRSDIIIWAITQLNHEEARILLNPFYVTNEIFNSRIHMKINGIPHGEKVILEINSSFFNVSQRYELTTMNLSERLTLKMNIDLDENYFSSAFQLASQYLMIYENDFYLLNDFNNTRFNLVGLTQTSFLISIIHYYRLILNYIDKELLYAKAIDFSQKIYSTISTHLFKYQIFYPEPGNMYLDDYVSLLIQLSSRSKLITYQTYHLFRHLMTFMSVSLPDTSPSFLKKLFDLCTNLRTYITSPKSIPVPTMVDADSLFEFNQIIGRILIMIHTELTLNGHFNGSMSQVNNAPLDFIVNMTPPFMTQRWHLKFDSSSTHSRHYSTHNQSFSKSSSRAVTNSLGILYYPQEYIPLYVKTSTTTSMDYLLGQLLSIESNYNQTLNHSASTSFSLHQSYLNTSNMLQKYFSKILLIRIKQNHYSHKFSFQMNTTNLARNISLIFFELPNSQHYLFTIHIAYNNSCLKSKIINKKYLEYIINIDLWQNNYFVYSIPITSMSIVCAQVELTTKDVSIRNLKRTGYFLVVETGCYSFEKNIYEDYYTKLQDDKCQLVNENKSQLSDNLVLSDAHLTCYCETSVTKYFVLCQPKPILVEFELNAQTWLHFYVYLSVLLFIFLLLGIYAIYKDTLDDYKPYVYFVADNQVGAVNVHIYQLTIFTGLQQSTSKHLKINIRLIGDKCYDESHCLNLNLSNVFQRGSVNQFVITSFVDIGRIVALNMWHDEINLKSDYYIRHCILYDYNYHRTYYFCCYTWLSLRKGLNMINEIFYVAQEVDQYAFGHLFLSTYAWLYYHYHLLNSIFNKQKINTLSRIYRLHIYFCLIIIQLYFIQTLIISCRNIIINQRCAYIFPSFSFLVDQSFVASDWIEIYQIIRLNLFPSLFIALFLSAVIGILTPMFIWSLTWFTNRLELYRQLSNATTDFKKFDNLHSIMYTMASSLADLNAYRQDIKQFYFIHKFDLQHRISISTLGESEQMSSQADGRSEQNNNAFYSRLSKSKSKLSSHSSATKNRQSETDTSIIDKVSRRNKKVDDDDDDDDDNDEYSLSNNSSQWSALEQNKTSSTIPLKVYWPKAPDQPSFYHYVFYSIIYYGISIIFGILSITCMYFTMKTFTEIENYFLTSAIIFIHILTIIFTLVFEIIIILLISLLNAIFFHVTDQEKFFSSVIQIPTVNMIDIKSHQLNHTFTLNQDITLTDVQLRERIRERFVESSIIRAVRDVIGYILFMVIMILVFANTSKNIETRLTMRQYTLQLLLREDIFQNINHLPDTMDWISYFIENRLFLDHKDYLCQKDTCNYVQIPDSPLYLSKSIRIRQIRVERKDCHPRINNIFYPLIPPSCFVGGKDLMNDNLFVIGGQRKCSGWNESLSYRFCKDVCNYTSIWSALAYRKITKLYTTFESPWYFMLHLLPKETVERCNRKRKYYDLDKNNWFDEKTLVVIIEGNLYSPQTASMISFVLIIEKNPFGMIEKEIFIQVSDYKLAIIEQNKSQNNNTEQILADENDIENQFIKTNFYFAALLFVIFTTKLFDLARFTRNFGFYGLVFFLRTLSNIVDGILLILCCYYFLLVHFDLKVLQFNNLIQSLNVHHLFVSFRVLIVNNTVLNHLIGLICLFAIFKLLYLLRFNPKTYLLAETIYQSAKGFIIILCFAFLNYFIFTLIGRLLFSNEENFKTFFVAFRVVLISSIRDAEPTDNVIFGSISRGLWQFFLWVFSAKIIEYFLISFVVQKFSTIRKTHQLTDEERIVGRIFQTFWTYFAFNKKI